MRGSGQGRGVLAGALALTLLAGCAASPARASTTTITVLAAASLTGTFTTIAADFEAAHPGVRVRCSFDGSPTLVTQVEQGAPADVVALADTATADRLARDGLIATPTIFATNDLVIAVPSGNPGHIATLDDLARPDVRTLVCAPAVPCGAAAAAAFAAAGVDVHPVSQEQSVLAVATKVAAGEADAGLVYRTDVLAASGALAAVPWPPDPAVTHAAHTTYPIAVLAGAPHPAWAAAFVDAVLGSRTTLAAAGFEFPGADG
ncbi:MAG: molybdate ABC transporter substrate-binding protein [Actinomycetia bacterium]|nr:molybdate ABC transporter substrate-binding protein [Actinomycetes bacterium]